MHNIENVIVTIVIPALVAFAIGAVGKLLVSPGAGKLAQALGDKLAAETKQAVASANHTNNILLVSAVDSLLSYAINHKELVEEDLKSRLDFVEAQIAKNPKLAALGATPMELEALVEQILSAYLNDLSNTPPAAATVIGGPGGK